MKYTLISKNLWLLLIFIYSCGKENHHQNSHKPVSPTPSALAPAIDKPTSYDDTLFILDEFASQPFSVDSVSPQTMQHLFLTPQIIKKPVANKFSAQQTDTVITFRKARSYVELYKVSTQENKCFYQSALIRDSMRVFSQPLQIGFTKEQVINLFSPLAKEKTLPDIIQISNETGTDYIYLIFQNNKLTTVKFRPYLD